MPDDLIRKILINPYVDVKFEIGGELSPVNIVQRLRDSRLLSAAENLYTVTMTDVLTGLPNMNLLVKDIRGTGMLYCIDIDNLRTINETYGTDYGDRLIIDVGKALKKAGQVYRGEGGRYYIFSDEDIIPKLRKHVINRVAISVGTATLPQDGNAVQIIKKATIAMYRAKSLGKGLVVNFKEKHIDDLEAENAIMLNIGDVADRVAIQSQSITSLRDGAEYAVLFYGTVVNVSDPDGMLAKYEESRASLPAVRKRIETALKYTAAHSKRVFVRVSRLSLIQHDFVRTMINLADSTGADPRLVVIDVCESEIANGIELAETAMARLDDIGFSFAVSNFGSGSSALSVLWRLPVSYLLVSQAFMGDFNDRSKKCVEMISELGRKSGCLVCLQDVSTEEQREFALSAGIEIITG